MSRVSRRRLLGAQVLDYRGEDLGRVVDTWPGDGSWELELVVVRLPRFGARRMLPASSLLPAGEKVRAIYSRAQVEDAPAVEDGRHTGDDPDRAKAYWRVEEAPGIGSLTPRWRHSSGFSGTVRRFPMAREPMTTVS